LQKNDALWNDGWAFTMYYLVWTVHLFVCFSGFHHFLNVCCHEYRSCEQSFTSLLVLLIFPVATFCWVPCTY